MQYYYSYHGERPNVPAGYPQPAYPVQSMPNTFMGQQSMPGIMPDDPYTYPQNYPAALELIRKAVEGEREDELFYEYLISKAPSEEERNIIRSIRDDERKHFRLFRQLYFELTGQTLPPPKEAAFERPNTYCAGIQKALFGELGAVERYRRILFAMQNRRHINIMTEIITDEQKHATKYNYIYAKNKCTS